MKVFYSSPHTISDFKFFDPELTITRNLEEADVVVFTGGADIDPGRYDQPTGMYTHSSIARDNQEFKVFNQALALRKPMFGICRGHQLLCVGLGGTLIQHSTHHYSHPIHTLDGHVLLSNSCHHQMIRPKGIRTKYIPLAWTNDLSNCYLDGNNQPIKFDKNEVKEIEVIAYPKLRILSCQFHPEWIIGSACNEWLKEQIQKFLFTDSNDKDRKQPTEELVSID